MKKIGEIKGVPVVEGNVNEVTRNQIHYKEDSGSIQLSKRGNDNKLNNVTGSSSSGDGEVKEYYYKTDESIKEEVIPILIELLSFNNVNVLLKKPFDEVIFETTLTLCFSEVEGATEQYAGYIKLDGRPSTVVRLTDNGALDPVGISEGNLTDRFNQIGMSEYSNYFQEITKEEYESMITYKPE